MTSGRVNDSSRWTSSAPDANRPALFQAFATGLEERRFLFDQFNVVIQLFRKRQFRVVHFRFQARSRGQRGIQTRLTLQHAGFCFGAVKLSQPLPTFNDVTFAHQQAMDNAPSSD